MDLAAILDGFESALTLERELGVRTVECDRALLLPCAPVPAATVQSAAATVPSAAAPAAPAPAVPSPAASAPPAPKAEGRAESPDFMFVGFGFGGGGKGDALLTGMIAAMGYARGDVSVLGIPAYGPDGKAEAARAVDAAVAAAKPKCIIFMGAPARALMSAQAVRSDIWREYAGRPAIATLHPDEILRFETPSDPAGSKPYKRRVWNTLLSALSKIGRPVPGKRGARGT